tara:strand:+ start:522 stop:1049 length:528 start_codon:yes stop_codon:yes gene_type:complete
MVSIKTVLGLGVIAVALPAVLSLQRPIGQLTQSIIGGFEEATKDPLGYLLQIPFRAGQAYDEAMARQETQAQQAQTQQQSQITENGQPILTNGITPSVQDTLETETIAIDCRARATERLRPDASKLEYLRSHALGEYCFEGDTPLQSSMIEDCNRWFKCKGTTAYPDIFPGYGEL